MFLSPEFITDFGDSAVTGAVALVAAVAFFFSRNRLAALAMLLALGVAALLTAIAKILLYGGLVFPAFASLHSPSGHTAISTAVYGTLVIILVAPLRKRYRIVAYMITVALIISIAATRVMLGRHSFADVVCGFIIGAIVCATLWMGFLSKRAVRINRLLLIAVVLVTVAILHGVHLPAETMIDDFAMDFVAT